MRAEPERLRPERWNYEVPLPPRRLVIGSQRSRLGAGAEQATRPNRAGPIPAEWNPARFIVLSIVVGVLVAIGAALGGTLVFDYGFNVETAGDSPVRHPSEIDVLPGDHSD